MKIRAKTRKPEIDLDVAALVERVEGFAAGQQPAREHAVTVPPPIKPITAKQIRPIA